MELLTRREFADPNLSHYVNPPQALGRAASMGFVLRFLDNRRCGPIEMNEELVVGSALILFRLTPSGENSCDSQPETPSAHCESDSEADQGIQNPPFD